MTRRPLLSTSSGHLAGADTLEDPALQRLLELLNPAGEETRLVGGVVRNALLGLPPGDIDLATTMLPEAVMRRAKRARLRTIPTGIAHGTVTIVSGGGSFEITTLREDVDTDGRHAVVVFGRDFARDAERRDFTMNALSLGADGRIFDTVGGLDDLAFGHVRFIGDAETRIREDFLRILRFFRFHASYGIGGLDADGLAASTRCRDGLDRLSRERVRAEILKILVAPGASEVLRAMGTAGILDRVLHGPGDLGALDRLRGLEGDRPDAILRLAALRLRGRGDLDLLRDLLRLTKAETKRLEAALRAGGDLDGLPPRDAEDALSRLLFVHGRQATADALLLHGATSPAGVGSAMPKMLDFVQAARIPALPVTGADLLGRGLNGPAVGAALVRFRDLWAERGFPEDKEAIDALLRQVGEPSQPTS